MKIRQSKFYCLATLMAGCCPLFSDFTAGTMMEESVAEAMADLPVIHPKFREWAEPGYGLLADRNPPILQWFAVIDDGVLYEVRLSTDPEFSGTSTFHQSGLSWAIFSPYEKLGAGTWYWQVRQAGGSWSEVHSFQIGTDSLGWAPPSPVELNRRVPHYRPRVLLDGPELSAFRVRVRGTGESARILGRADAVLETEPPEENREILEIHGRNEKETKKLRLDASEAVGQALYAGVRPLCEAYLISGASRYAEAAVRWALKASDWDPEGVTHLSDFGDSRIMLSMALAYDTLQAFLAPEEQQRLLAAAGARADNFYHHYVDKSHETKVLSGHFWQHILHYLFDTAIALHGDDPRAETWLAYVYETFLARAPVLGGKDGGWAEGISYLRMNMEMLIDIPWKIRHYTGFDFIKSTPWYEQNVDLLLYQFPPGSVSAGFADNTHELPEPRGDYLAYADALSRLLENPFASWYRERILDLTPDLTPYYQAYWRSHFITDDATRDSLEDTRLLRWQRLRYLYSLPAPPPKAPSDLPKARVFRGEGLVAMHGQPLGENPEKNLFVAMRSSPFGVYGHMLADHNSFNLAYGGERLFYHTGYKVAMSAPHRRLYYMNTKSHNGILVNGEGQPYHTEAFGWIEHFLDGDHLSYAAGNASRAYDSVTENLDTGLKTFRRHLLLLRPDVLVIYDELEAEKPVSWTYLLHSYSRIEIDPGKGELSVQNDKGWARVALSSSENTDWSVTSEYPVPAKNWRGIRDENGVLLEYPNDAWHFSAESGICRRMRFMAVFQVKPLSAREANSVDDFVKETSPGIFRVGNWEIACEMNPDHPAGLKVRNSVQSVAFSSAGAPFPVPGVLEKPSSPNFAQLAEKKSGAWQVQVSAPEIPPGALSAIRHFQKSQLRPIE